jgi:hypothetical protein
MEIRDYCHWAASCGRKKRYRCANHARMCMSRILRQGNGIEMETLATYRCSFCGGFHMGHARSNRQARAAERA